MLLAASWASLHHPRGTFHELRSSTWLSRCRSRRASLARGFGDSFYPRRGRGFPDRAGLIFFIVDVSRRDERHAAAHVRVDEVRNDPPVEAWRHLEARP